MAVPTGAEGGPVISSRDAKKAKYAIPVPLLQCYRPPLRNKWNKIANISNCDGGTKLFVAGKTRIENHHDVSIENKYAFEIYQSILFIFASKLNRNFKI